MVEAENVFVVLADLTMRLSGTIERMIDTSEGEVPPFCYAIR